MSPTPTRAAAPRVVLLHPALTFSGTTERTLATARVLRAAGCDVTVVSRPGSRALAFETAEVPVRWAELPTRPREQPFAVRRTRRLLTELGPTVLHATHTSLAPLAAALAARLRVPYLLEVGVALTGPLPVEPSRLHRVVLTAPTLAEAAVNRGQVPRDRLAVIEHGPTPPAGARCTPFRHGAEVRVGCSGHLVRRRGTWVLLEAAHLLSLGGRQLSFWILGEGPEEARLRRRVRELALGDHVTIAAPSTPTAADLLLGLDLHVCCNLDGVPDWLAHEALALGIPSILSAVSASFALVEDDKSGVLVERGSPDDLAREIARLVDAPSTATSLGAAARARILERDVGGAFERGLTRTYEELLSAAPAT